MTRYAVPLARIRATLDHVGLADLLGLAGVSPSDAGALDDVLAEAARFAEQVIAPLNRVGDVQGARLEDGRVRMPEGFAEAYRSYVDAGWGALDAPVEHGGGGWPAVVALAVQEMVTSADLAFSLCPMLTHGAVDLLTHHASPDQQARWLPALVSGEWTGTMNLTEPDAGSDLGAVRTTAERADDGTWRVRGTKIFITYGDHDLADNIVHLVLARTPGSPPGTRGLSLFLVPARLPGPDGRPGEPNDITVVSIEHKLGIHASPTCVLSYGDAGGAVAELVGAEHSGIAAMFTMMNNARLLVGLEGLAVAERAAQAAEEYARVRRQGRRIDSGSRDGDEGPVPIEEHADVRRMLLTMRSQIDAMRTLLYSTVASVDRSRHAGDDAERRRHEARVALLTPVAKAWCTDLASEITSLAVQVHGGLGYIEETGVAQHLRDARITSIYEGTNGIQAVDLVFRKIGMDGGTMVRDHLAELAAVAARLQADGGWGTTAGERLDGAVAALREATDHLLERLADNRRAAAAAATPYLRLFGLVTGGALLGDLALRTGDPELVHSARFFAAHLLPAAGGLRATVLAGDEALDDGELVQTLRR